MRVTRKIFNQEKKLSPVPVIEMNYRDYIKKTKKLGIHKRLQDVSMDSGGSAVAGSLIYYRDKKGKPFIFIYKYVSLHIKMATLFHEMGHYHCEENNCNCFDSSYKHLEEIHAEEFCVKKLIEREYYMAIGMWMSNVVAISRDPFDSLYKAYNRILKKRIWKKCIKLLTDHGHGEWVKRLLKELNKKRKYF